MSKNLKLSFLTITLAFTLSAQGSFLRRFTQTTAASTVLAGTGFVGYHENAWRQSQKQMATATTKFDARLAKPVNFAFEHPEASKHLDPSTNPFISDMQSASELMGLSENISHVHGQAVHHLRFALITRLKKTMSALK